LSEFKLGYMMLICEKNGPTQKFVASFQINITILMQRKVEVGLNGMTLSRLRKW